MADMGLASSFGAGGAVDALQQVLAQRQAARQFMADQAYRQQMLELEQRRLDEQAAYRQMQQTELQRTHDEANAVREENAFWHGLDVAPPAKGTVLSPEAAAPYRRYAPGLLQTQPLSEPAPPDALAATPGEADTAVAGTVANSPDPGAIQTVFAGTRKQAEDTAAQAAKQADLERRLQDSQERATEAWQRLSQQGQTQDALAQFRQSQIDLATTRASLERERAQTAANQAALSQPQFFRDSGGNVHAVVFDRVAGQLKEIPVPAGYVPTKAAPPGIFDRISSWFGGGGSAPSASATDPTDPNWGK